MVQEQTTQQEGQGGQGDSQKSDSTEACHPLQDTRGLGLEWMVQERVKAKRNKQPGTSDSVHGKQPEKSDTQGGGGTELASGQDNPPLPVLERREYGRQSEQTTGEGHGY